MLYNNVQWINLYLSLKNSYCYHLHLFCSLVSEMNNSQSSTRVYWLSVIVNDRKENSTKKKRKRKNNKTKCLKHYQHGHINLLYPVRYNILIAANIIKRFETHCVMIDQSASTRHFLRISSENWAKCHRNLFLKKEILYN